MDLKDQTIIPVLDDISVNVNNSNFDLFCEQIKNHFHAKEVIEFSKCSWAYGWNIKFKKSGKNLCTIYPHEKYFTVLVVIGKKEKEETKQKLENMCSQVQSIYHETQEGNGQRWCMIDIEDYDSIFKDTLKLIEIKAHSK